MTESSTPETRKATPGRADARRLREDFPILSRRVHGKPLVYLDNAATTQKPLRVLEALDRFYRETNANIHRGVHHLSEAATRAYELARHKVQRFLNAERPEEIVFVRGATEAINLVAQSWGRREIGPGDEVVVSALEHHSNLVPWQMVCEERGARIRVIPVNEAGDLRLGELEKLLGERTRLVAVTHVSNALGTIPPLGEIIGRAHDRGIAVLVDGAQAVPHLPVDVRSLGADFYVFSGHKVYGPTGIGALYAKAALLEDMPPYQGGGEMIESVTFETTTYKTFPHRFEAGTPHVAGAVGLGEALDYLAEVGLDRIAAHEEALLEYATGKLASVPGLRLIGTATRKIGVISFLLEGLPAHDAALLLDQDGIAVRAGHHCAQPLLEMLGVSSTLRASLALYNTEEDLDALIEALRRLA